jgi:hypothetical protein
MVTSLQVQLDVTTGMMGPHQSWAQAGAGGEEPRRIGPNLARTDPTKMPKLARAANVAGTASSS